MRKIRLMSIKKEILQNLKDLDAQITEDQNKVDHDKEPKA